MECYFGFYSPRAVPLSCIERGEALSPKSDPPSVPFPSDPTWPSPEPT